MSAARLSLAARVALHAGSISVCRYAFAALPLVDRITGLDIGNMTGGHYQFLTICSLQMTELVMYLALAADLVPEITGLTDIKQVALSIALPMEIVVSILYWSLQLADPDLVAPPREVPDPLNPGQTILQSIVMPYLPDLAMHAVPPVLLMLDYLLFSRRLASPKLRPLYTSLGSTLCYVAWVEFCASRNNMYPYPILSLVPTWARFLIYAIAGLLTWSGRRFSDFLHRAIYGDKVPPLVTLRETSLSVEEKARKRSSWRSSFAQFTLFA